MLIPDRARPLARIHDSEDSHATFISPWLRLAVSVLA